MVTTPRSTLLPELQTAVETLIQEFGIIPEERKELLAQLSDLIAANVQSQKNTALNFICTHNSRRSHIAQLWAQTAAHYFSIPGIQTFSGGTEATAFNPRAVKAMKDAGFETAKKSEGENPQYVVRFSDNGPVVKAFSKKYNDPFNPEKNFIAIMTCSHADENCPLVSGASKRIAITYDDPKDFDGTPLEEDKYRERVMEIGREILYAFSRVNSK